MGSSFSPDGAPRGVIPCVMDTIFERIAAAPDASFTVRVGFVEVLLVRAPRDPTLPECPGPALAGQAPLAARSHRPPHNCLKHARARARCQPLGPQAALEGAGGIAPQRAGRTAAAPGLACDGAAPGRAAREEFKDLLAPEGGPPAAVHIREVRGGGVCLVGAAEKEVGCKAEMAAVLEQVRGAGGRAGPWALGRARRWTGLGAGAGAGRWGGVGAGEGRALGMPGRWEGLGAGEGWVLDRAGRWGEGWAGPDGLAAAC